jgi:hypothetical protein
LRMRSTIERASSSVSMANSFVLPGGFGFA